MTEKQTSVLAAYEVTHAPPPPPLSIAFPAANSGLRKSAIPPLSYTLQNVLISIGTLVGACSSLVLTVLVALPASIVRACQPSSDDTSARKKYDDVGQEGENELGQDRAVTRKVVLIVGASRGLGSQILKQYAGDVGTTIIAVSKHAEPLKSTISELGDTVATIHAETLDISRPASEVAAAVRELDSKYGPITHAFAVAAVTDYTEGEVKPWDVESMDSMIQVNVSGITSVVMAAYDCMKARKSGKICIIGSIAGHYAPANMLGYASTKAFLNTFATSLRVLAAAHNIDVVCVQPGYLDTQITRAMRFKPQHASPLPAFLFADPAKLAPIIKSSLESDGKTVGVITSPTYQSVFIYVLKGLNPMWEEVGRWASMKCGVAGWSIS